MLSAAQRLAERAQFIRYTQKHAFAVFRQREIQREHMRAYHIALNIAECKVALRVFERRPRVRNAVQSALARRVVPVVEKIIVQESTANECAPIHPQTEQQHEKYAQQRDADRMVVHVAATVMHILLFALHTRRGQNIPAATSKLQARAPFYFSEHRADPPFHTLIIVQIREKINTG